MHYLNWAKTHEPARYELSGSGVPRARLADFGADGVAPDLEVRGTYGDPALIDAIAARYGVASSAVLPVPGTSSANFIALAVAARSGEAVMIERPSYDPFERIASFLHLTVMPLRRAAESGFAVDPAAVEAGLAAGARAIVLTNLHNPSGCGLTTETIAETAQACARTNAFLIVDEVYFDGACLVSGRPCWTAASVAPNVLVTSSLTKVYGMGGLRIGWLIADGGIMERARDVMDLLSVVNAAPAMALAVQAFAEMPRLEARYRGLYEEGQAVFRRWLAGESRVMAYPSAGALFECLRLPAGVDADRFTASLAAEHETQAVSGSFFGLDGHIRISIAPERGGLAEGLSRISAALSAYPR